ncbi:hypothetical protein [Oenococcus oeni]|uniref:hypothetical protein n=1 Tax=Oenococcus oeni TaxID=1247 RepID=UPI00003C993C|nr:hypothetical protein [Oenococcus oeni]KEK01669.1 hypothetical protein HL43_03875 [Oenococcus oeni]KEP85478.1 hypothetical protein X278_08575 [Oenococcus oeni IOEB_0205]KER92588.1 hypothetical protein HS16_07435 [Oenococcus oeni]KER94170.1 hypothetical protein HR58_07425 [Oenococcus oeni]KER95591.1 hypothetical protein HT63_07435 [Oenococcus oeni]
MEQARYYKKNGAETIALTANSYSVLNQVTDFAISYDTPQNRKGHINVTTQVPIVYTLEQISNCAYHKMVDQVDNRFSEHVTDW